MRETNDVQRQCTPAPLGDYILLIDDEETVLDVLVAFLRDEEGYTVVAARSGAEALDQVPETPPAIIFMDIHLHNEKPEEVAQNLRTRPGWSDAALVVCTAHPNIHDYAKRLGANAYLAKPFDLDDLLDLVTRFGPRR
jgi:CheY-like chemotaxis protein